ncbi:MAG: LPS export ABC transporter permease LptF [Pseudomonadota bacterium]
MSRLNRYVYRQLIGPFAFFVLVFTGIIWLSQSLRVIETVVNNGQSALVFLEFTALLLPRVMTVVLPVAGFAATLYAINRLYGDSEITVMFAAGRSGLSLLRPVAMFGVTLALFLTAIAIYVVPHAQREMRDRITEVRGDVAAAFLREGAFITPSPGVTVFVRRIGGDGALDGVFIHDSRDAEQIATYTAQRAVLLGVEGATRLIMFDGTAQIADPARQGALTFLRFDQLGYDLSQFGGESGNRLRKPSELFLPELLTIDAEEAARRLRPVGEFRAEAHEALSAPLYAIALPFLAVALVISAGFRRQGFLGRIIVAIVAALALRVLGLAAKSATAGEAALWPLMYAPPLLGVVAAFWLLSAGGMRPRGRRRPGPAATVAATGRHPGTPSDAEAGAQAGLAPSLPTRPRPVP